MSRADVERYIGVATEAFPTLRGIVFTEGECFLLGSALVEAVAHATGRKLSTRCVSNGYWGTSERAAARRLEPLVRAGLKEINFSTGPEHQRFVPYDRVATAATCAAAMGLVTLVNVEAAPGASFDVHAARSHPTVQRHEADHPRSQILFISSIWTDLEARSRSPRQGAGASVRKGCDSVLQHVAIEPGGHVLGCCGLTSTRIRELVLGKDLTATDLRRAYDAQYDDLVKLWISLDGPVHAARTLGAMDEPSWVPPTHACAACAELFTGPRFAQALQRDGAAIAPDVVFRFHVREQLMSAKGGS